MKNLWMACLLGFLAQSAFAEVENSDPFEPLNRAIYSVNMALDEVLLEPVARAYVELMPEIVQRSTYNFFSNLEDVGTLSNQILQFKLEDSINTTVRILINSSIGLLGLFDFAAEAGLAKTQEDFGQTLGYWGIGSGAYVMLPIFGPSSLRDALGLGIDMSYNVKTIAKLSDPEKYYAYAVNTIDARAGLLSATDMFKRSDDPYVAMRAAFFQNREYAVTDGEISDDEF